MQFKNTSQRSLLIWSLAIGVLGLTWGFWGSISEMAVRWDRDPEYSHGFLIPLLAVVLLWYRFEILEMGRPKGGWLGSSLLAGGVVALFLLPAGFLAGWGFLFAGVSIVGAGLLLRPTEPDWSHFAPSWWGLPLLVGGIVMRLASAHYYFEWFDHLSLIPCLGGIVLLTLGRRAIHWAWPAVVFVVFMIPLPHSLEGAMREPLRKVGTIAGTFLMQTLGLPAAADGNRHEILVGGMTHRIGVDEACSGLSMLMIFFALCTAVAVVIRRPIWEKGIVLASALPIALIANILRITTTGMMLYSLEGEHVFVGWGDFALIDMSGSDFAQSFFHDWAGWMMMPLALVLLWLELAIVSRIIVVEEDVPMSSSLIRPEGTTGASTDTAGQTKPVETDDRSSKTVHAASTAGR